MEKRVRACEKVIEKQASEKEGTTDCIPNNTFILVMGSKERTVALLMSDT
jgi:hypothetical protein